MNTNWFDPALSNDHKAKAETVLQELMLQKAFLRVRFDQEVKALTFTQDRRVVEVPIVLIEKAKWSEIRYLFRAILESAPSQWNYSADKNDWSAYKG